MVIPVVQLVHYSSASLTVKTDTVLVCEQAPEKAANKIFLFTIQQALNIM